MRLKKTMNTAFREQRLIMQATWETCSNNFRRTSIFSNLLRPMLRTLISPNMNQKLSLCLQCILANLKRTSSLSFKANLSFNQLQTIAKNSMLSARKTTKRSAKEKETTKKKTFGRTEQWTWMPWLSYRWTSSRLWTLTFSAAMNSFVRLISRSNSVRSFHRRRKVCRLLKSVWKTLKGLKSMQDLKIFPKCWEKNSETKF
jgi:hypothetical protein